MKHGQQLRFGKLFSQLETLLSQQPEKMKDAVMRYPQRHGVYAISDPDDNEIVYVGMSKTAKEGVGQRLSDHVNNNETSDLKTKVDGEKKKAEEYYVRIFEEDDFIARRNLENFAIGVLSPKFNIN